MRKIGLLSDTHGYFPEKTFEFFSKSDEIWHAGDIGNEEVLDKLEAFRPLKAVFGNIDNTAIRSRTREVFIENINGVKMAMLHIGGYPGRYAAKAREMIIRERPNVFISGHSHILKVMYDKHFNLLHINPGAAGKTGLHHKITLVRFDIDQAEIKNLEIFESDRKA